MKMVKSLLLGTAAGVVAMAGAQAADLPVKARPVQYVKICSLYGAGFYYIPGTDTCIKIGGFVRTEFNLNAGGSFSMMHDHNFDNRAQDWYDQRTRGGFTFDARSQTEYGTLRAYILASMQDDNGNGAGGSPYFPGKQAFANAAFIQWAGFTFGKTGSFFDFDTFPYSNQSNMWGSNQGGNGIPVWAYTAQFGNGLSASLSLENTNSRRSDIFAYGYDSVPGNLSNTSVNGHYGGYQWPDIVGNLRIDQAWGSAQVMGAIHDVNASYYSANTSAHPSDKVGFAVGAGLKLNLPMLGKGDYAIGQVTYAEGAMNYLGSDFGSGDNYFLMSNGYPIYTSVGLGQVYDAVVGPYGSPYADMQLTTGWTFTGGIEHHWNSMWKTSLYGSYGEISYNSNASFLLQVANGIGGPSSSANWSFWNIGSRTVWQPVENLDFSVDVVYNNLNTAFAGDTAPYSSAAQGPSTFKDKDWVGANIRVQRNFYP